MNPKAEIYNLLEQIHNCLKTKPKEKTLPSSCYFLDDDFILALPRKDGDSRYPYSCDGLILWAHASGYISINESSFYLFPPTLEGREPRIMFFGGIKNNDGYTPYSITGVLNDLDDYSYCVFGKKYVYYIKELNNVIFALRLGINSNKDILISAFAFNNTNKDIDIYLSSYMNPIMEHNACDSEESKWFKKCTLNDDGCTFLGVEDVSRNIHLTNYANIKRAVNRKDIIVTSTSSKACFSGGKHIALYHSKALKMGEIKEEKKTTLFSETSAYSDIVKSKLKNNESLQVDYKINISFNEKDNEYYQNKSFKYEDNDVEFIKLKDTSSNIKDFCIEFGPLNDNKLNNSLLNQFIKNVIYQVDYGANAKNSSLMLLGIRDVFQMVEASLLWDLKSARKIILKCLNFIDPSGQSPRQFSLPSGEENPLMDNREFIDQGQWIISTIYTYLSYSNDKSILDEECKYCELIGLKSGKILNITDSVYKHLEKIINYLIKNIDEDTGCLKTLYGDWNDAIDGLGRSSNQNESFGNGVSSMASFHLYKNLIEMANITKYYSNDENKINYYLDCANRLKKSVNKHCIISKEDEKRIVHGWGENKSFFVGSFKDVDNKNRHSLTSNAFYCISGLYEDNKDIKNTILKAYECLDSKYGYKTFDEYFDRDAYKVGRIINLPKGTAENAATYIHSVVFAIKSLFMLDEGEKAFEQIYKIIPLTHKFVSTSPFVMPNSYIYNPEIGVDGESMNDWYTGSSNTLIKTLVFDLFGLKVDLTSIVKIKPSNYFPCDDAHLTVRVKNKLLKINYQNMKQGKRKIIVNDETINDSFDVSKIQDEIINIQIID